MTAEIEEAELVPTGPSWYSKIFEYMKNRNRIGPGKVELPECDFFIVGPRRTLRVLIPTPKGSEYYEMTGNERPETIDENFVSRWAMRPHPSGNCRCSFRQSNRLSSNEERIISAEINRIRTSLCEAERSGQDIEELEQRISLNLEGLSITDTQPRKNQESRSEVDEKLAEIANVGPPIGSKSDDDLAIRKKIVKDLEKYIEVLLQEVLNDTIKFFSDAGDTLKKSRDALKSDKNSSCGSVCSDPYHLHSCKSSETKKIKDISKEHEDPENFGDGPSSLNISFAFHELEKEQVEEEKGVLDFGAKDKDGGYVNRAFSGSNTDPDSLDFDLRKPVNAEMTIDHLDCIDSGINSVETIEFQPSQEPSLEQSLMEIIDAKLGRAPLKRSWEDLSDKNVPKESDETICTNLGDTESIITPVSTDKNRQEDISNNELRSDFMKEKEKETSNKVKDTVGVEQIILKEDHLGESSNELQDNEDQQNFDKLRLELIGSTSESKKCTISTLREKFSWKFGKNREQKNEDLEKEKNVKIEEISSSPVELRVKNEIIWDNRETSENIRDENSVDFVKFRKNRKPTIVFLHGFGSSAEIFEHQLQYFSNLGYPCIAPEMLGHGMSSAPDRSRDYHFDKLFKDLEMVLQHYAFKPGRKCVLVAHNYGCSFATALACKYDSNIHQLVLISGGGPTPLAPPSSEGAGHCCLRAMLTPLLMCGLHRDILYSARGRQHPYCGPEPPEQWPSHMKYVLDGMVWPEGDYVFHRRICTPTLLIHGLRDNKVSLVQECQMERTIIKAFLDAIPTAGHTPMTDCPEQVNHMIHCFIDLWRRKKR